MTMTLDGSGANTIGVPNSATAQNATGSTVTFTGIPAGTKRITLIFNNVSLSGGANLLVRLGSGSLATTGYLSSGSICGNGSTPAIGSSTTGFYMRMANSAYVLCVQMTITLVSGNTWISSYNGALTSAASIASGGGSVTLGGTLDRVGITNDGADTFDAGSFNILYE